MKIRPKRINEKNKRKIKSNIMIQRNVEAGHDLCLRINRAQNASIPSPLRAGGSASADHGVIQIEPRKK